MLFVRRAITVAVLLVCLTIGCGGSGGGGPAASDETLSTRVVDYFGKAVSTPGVTFKVTKIEPSEIPGWRKGHLEAALGEQKQDVPFYISNDGRYLFRSDAIDLTLDPFQAVMQKIKLDGAPSRGPADAKVTIVEFSDFECPYC